MMEDEVRRHPDFVQFQKDLNETQLRVSRWEHDNKNERKRIETDRGMLKNQESQDAQRLDTALKREAENADERNRIVPEIESAKSRMENTKSILEQAITEEDVCAASISPIRNQIDSIKSTLGSSGPKKLSIEKELEAAQKRLHELETSLGVHVHHHSSSLEHLNQFYQS